jgi:dethiobiotin synthetase
MRAVAVWGCGTGIGKTLLSAGLMRAAAARGAPALFVKPVQTGVPDSDGATVARLRGSSCRHEPAAHAAEAGLGVFTSANGGAAPLTRVTTLFAWRAPISPHLASAREGRPVSDGEVVRATSAELQAFEAAVRAAGTAAGVTARTAANAAPAVESGVQAGSGIVVSGRDPNSAVEGAVAVVETAGGVSSPGPSGSIQCDILSPLGLPALLVGDARLGGISATLCAAEALTARGHALAAVVLFEEAGAAEELGNAEALRWHLGGLREGGKGGAGSGGISMSSAAVGGAVGGGGGGGAQGSAPTPRLLSREGGVPVIQVEAPPPMPEPLDAWMERNAPAFESILMRIAHGTRGREKGVGGRADGAGEVAQATEGERRAAVTQEATAAPQAAVDDSAAGTVPSGCPFLLSRASPLPPSRDASALLAADSRLLWHPYTSTTRPAACMPVARAKGVHLFLADGTRLLDGMSSWWAAIHG